MGLADKLRARVRLPEVLRHGWEERVSALRNVPAVMRMFWDSAPTSVALSLVFRLISSLVPLGVLLATRLIINGVVAHVARHEELPKHFWLFVVAAFLMAGLSVGFTRAIEDFDAILAS